MSVTSTSVSRAAVLMASLLIAVVIAPQGGWAATETGFPPSPTFTFTGPGADFVAAGTSTRGSVQGDPFMLTMPAPGGTVVATFISWSYLLDGTAPATDTIVVNGHSVVGNLIGSGQPDLCWQKDGAASYLASVPAGVVLTGSNTISGATDKALGTDSGAYGEGLGILEVFSTGTGAPRDVEVWDGYSSTESGATQYVANVALTFNQTYQGGGAHFLLDGIDGQSGSDFEDSFFVNGVSAGGVLAGTGAPDDAWQGLLGPYDYSNLYDLLDDTLDVPYLSPGATGLVATTTNAPFRPDNNYDCIGHSLAAIAFDVPAQEAPAPVLGPAGLGAMALVLLAFGVLSLARRRA